MSWLVLLSGVLATATAAFHLLAGGKEVVRPLLKSTMDAEVKLAAYACWHLVSVMMVVSSLVLLAHGSGLIAWPEIVAFVSVLWLLLGTACLSTIVGAAKPGDLLRLPQWLLMLAVGLLGLLGSA